MSKNGNGYTHWFVTAIFALTFLVLVIVYGERQQQAVYRISGRIAMTQVSRVDSRIDSLSFDLRSEVDTLKLRVARIEAQVYGR